MLCQRPPLGIAAGCSRSRRSAVVSAQRVRHRSRVVASAASPWRLADAGVAPQFVRLAQDIETLWLSHAGMGALAPLAVEPRFVTADGGAEAERLRLENRFYATPVFRKCHLELAAGGAGLSVLHCVMYPWPAHDLPLFSVDMVAFGPRVTLAIADVCPSREDLSLPSSYAAAGELTARMRGLKSRGIPEWGTRIFSEHCMCVSPQADGDVPAFCDYTLALLALHLEAAAACAALPPRAEADVAATAAAHARFCRCQLENDKTRRILAKAFGAQYADAYMESVLFDVRDEGAVPLRPPPAP